MNSFYFRDVPILIRKKSFRKVLSQCIRKAPHPRVITLQPRVGATGSKRLRYPAIGRGARLETRRLHTVRRPTPGIHSRLRTLVSFPAGAFAQVAFPLLGIFQRFRGFIHGLHILDGIWVFRMKVRMLRHSRLSSGRINLGGYIGCELL